MASETQILASEIQILACSPLNLTYKILMKGTGTNVHMVPFVIPPYHSMRVWTIGHPGQIEGRQKDNRWTDSFPCVLQDFVPFGPLPQKRPECEGRNSAYFLETQNVSLIPISARIYEESRYILNSLLSMTSCTLIVPTSSRVVDTNGPWL